MPNASSVFGKLEIAPELQEKFPELLLLYSRISLEPHKTPADLRPGWEALHKRWSGKSKENLKQDAAAAAYCDFYRQIGLNPNRQPPSALNLVQRFLLAEKLTRIPLVTPVVDAANLASAETLVPIAVFDADRLACPLRLDRSLLSEQFLGFGYVEPEDLQPGTIILRDRERVLSIFCYRDGQYQAVSADTRNILLIACRVTDIEIKLVETALERTKELLSQSFGVIQS